MYHPDIIEQSIRGLRRTYADIIPPTLRTPEESIHVARFLQSTLDREGKPTRQWTEDEQKFILSETLLCRASFRYFCERYGNCEVDSSEGTGIRPMKFWPSQERALSLVSDREKKAWEDYKAHGRAHGVMGVWHKTRQQGATAVLRLMCLHRMLFYKNTRSMAASLDGPKVHELYVRDWVIIDNLPFFLRPTVENYGKDDHIAFSNGSRLVYQQSNQEAGVGTGQQFDASHCTEVALWPYAERLQFDFLPAVGQSPRTLVGWESTANGKGGFWYDFTENIRKRKSGFEHWIYSFTPWYINHNKNVAIPAPDWTPASETVAQAALVESTSFEFAGSTIRLNQQQMYWWEREYRLNAEMGSLAVFFSNYPSTPEQSFQYSAQGAFSYETMEWLRAQALLQKGMPYHISWRN